MKVVWGESKRRRNAEAHGLDFADARDRFDWTEAMILPTYPSRFGTARLTATGYLDDTLVFALLGTEALSFISLRSASRRERRRYEKPEA